MSELGDYKRIELPSVIANAKHEGQQFIVLTMQPLVRLILGAPQNYEWSLQGLGMLRLYLPGDARLHIWDQRFAFPGASPIHDHLQWGLTSTVISGQLVNTRYWECYGEPAQGHAKPYHWARFKAGYGAEQLHEPKTMWLEEMNPEVYGPGQSYSQEPDEIHQTNATPGTITIMHKRPTADGETARIFWPEGTKWGSAEPRPATAEEVHEITDNARKVMMRRS